MLRDLPVRDVMTTDVVTFAPDQNVNDAMRVLVERGVDSGPVLDGGTIVGMLSTGDLVVEEARVHYPTIVNFLGVNVTLPFEHQKLDDSVAKALGASVGEVMTAKPLTISADATVEDAATLMHDHEISRLPVVDDDGGLVGIVARGDILRAIVAGTGEDEPREPSCRCAPRGPRSTSMPSPTTCARCASWSRRLSVCAVVKADGYGHGAIAVGRAAVEAGATWLGVALVEEGAVLRRSGIDVPILLLSQPRPADIDSAVQLGLRLSAYTADGLDAIAASARRHGVARRCTSR